MCALVRRAPATCGGSYRGAITGCNRCVSIVVTQGLLEQGLHYHRKGLVDEASFTGQCGPTCSLSTHQVWTGLSLCGFTVLPLDKVWDIYKYLMRKPLADLLE